MNNALLAALPEGAIIVNQQGEVEAANTHAIELLQADVVGTACASVIRAPAFLTAFNLAKETGEAQSAAVEFHGRPSRHVDAYIAPLGATGHTLVVLRDLTRQQAIEKMRSDFVANASHEMRTPLATIIGSIETLQGAARNDPDARDMFLTSMLSQAHRMKRLIDDLLTLSRIELNEHVRPNKTVAVFNVLKQAKSNLAQQAAAENISVTLSGDADIIVAGDADELLQVAQNLLENAIKYGGHGGRIELACSRQQEHAVLSVRDFGKGIAEIHLPRLTERFYRVSTKESRQRGGTGLGLAIVKHIVQRHRGRLDIASAPDQGSTFSVSIPLVKS